MDIITRVTNALSGTLPSSFGSWDTTPYPAQYGVFTTMSAPNTSSEDKVDEILHYVYLEMFSTINFIAKQSAVHTAMEAAGFKLFEERGRAGQLSMTWTYQEAM
jgi:hypothetical protein